MVSSDFVLWVCLFSILLFLLFRPRSSQAQQPILACLLLLEIVQLQSFSFLIPVFLAYLFWGLLFLWANFNNIRCLQSLTHSYVVDKRRNLLCDHKGYFYLFFCLLKFTFSNTISPLVLKLLLLLSRSDIQISCHFFTVLKLKVLKVLAQGLLYIL